MQRILFAFMLLFLPLSSFADRISIAILDLDAKGVEPCVACVVTESTKVVGAHGGAPSSEEGAPAGMTFLKVNEQGYKEYRNEKDWSVMIYIPAGEFRMGSKDYKNEKPIHEVYLDAYYIDKYEVTVGQYRQFCSAAGRKMVQQPDWNQGDTLPVVDVKWENASAYASWAGKRLPSEAEWEKAARGSDGRRYPWGNTWDASKCNSREPKGSGPFAYTKPVGSFPLGASPYGVMDMAGNLMEWCQDWYDEVYYQNSPSRNPTGPASGSSRVMRGGSWFDDWYECRSTCRRSAPLWISTSEWGFRCAR
jgi:sulfatase modifying factor 1